ncbi:MAG: acyltransferase [Desmonostoc vinosum HA7617-LM4]|jgi:hypothetical protein|nr:acyltransferase [Desmonostoc vinosum HA7617-LM4]
MKNVIVDSSLLPSNQTTGRLLPLDILKAVSIIAVVSFHSLIVPKTTYASSTQLLDIIFSPLKFCVPVLFTISFFLLEKGLAKPQKSILLTVQKRLTRLLTPTIFWFSIALFLKLINKNSVNELIAVTFKGRIFEGAYYLIALLQLFIIFICLRNLFNKPRNLLLTVLLQILIFLYIYAFPSTSLYHDQIISVLRTIDRPLFIYWFVYIALGFYFCKNWSSVVKLSNQISVKIKGLLLVLYCCIQILEYRWVFQRLQGEIPPFDYITISCILSVFVMFFCCASIQENQVFSLIKRLITMFSTYSLGIFCINGILYQICLAISDRFLSETVFNFPEVLMLKIISWIALLTISLGLSIFIDRIGLKALVR